MPMSRAQFKKQLQEGVNTVFGLEYARHPEEWRYHLDFETSKKAYEEDVLMSGLDAAQVKAEGRGVHYSEGRELWTQRYTHETIALAFALTEEAEQDNLYGSIGKRYGRALARSMQHTKEVKGANVLNNGFDANYAIGDGKALFATDHPLENGQTLRNELATPADLSEFSLEQALVDIDNYEDDKGIPIATRAVCLIVHANDQFTADRLLNSSLRPGTSDNDINSIGHQGSISNGYKVNHRLTDSRAWFIKTDCPDGMKHIQRMAIRRGIEGDFETGNMRYKAWERYAQGTTDPRGAYGSAGGAG